MVMLRALTQYQWGKESTKGTAIAATSKIACQAIDWSPVDEVNRPQLLQGLTHRNPGGHELIVARGSEFSVAESPVVFGQFQHWLELLFGSVFPIGTNPGPYTWTFVRNASAVPNPVTRTIERRIDNGTSQVDNEWTYACLRELTITYEMNQPLRFTAQGFARRIQSSTFTAGQTLPAVAIAPAPLATAFLDGAWANLGTTRITGELLSATVTYRSGFKPKMTLDGRTDLDFTSSIFDPTEAGVDVALRLLVGGQYAEEKLQAEAAGLRALRLKLTSGANELQLDTLLKHTEGSVFALGDEDGQHIVELNLVDADDATNLLQAVLINLVNTDT